MPERAVFRTARWLFGSLPDNHEAVLQLEFKYQFKMRQPVGLPHHDSIFKD